MHRIYIRQHYLSFIFDIFFVVLNKSHSPCTTALWRMSFYIFSTGLSIVQYNERCKQGAAASWPLCSISCEAIYLHFCLYLYISTNIYLHYTGLDWMAVPGECKTQVRGRHKGRLTCPLLVRINDVLRHYINMSFCKADKNDLIILAAS